MYIEVTVNINFLGLQIDNHINWKNCIKQRFLSYVQHVMPLGYCSISVTLTQTNQFPMHMFILL